MMFFDTGRVIIGCNHNPANMPIVDTGWQQIILSMNENKDTTAAQRGFFNALPRHIKGLATYRSNHSEGLE